MDHIAVMSKGWKWKKVESRWLKNKSAPWGKVKAGDTIYFKDSGGPIKVKTTAVKVREYEDLTEPINIMNKYLDAQAWAKGKKYCVLIWLGKPIPLKPLKINKRSRAGWVSVNDLKYQLP